MSTDANPSFEQRVQDRQDAVEAWVRRNITKGSWARIIRMARKPSPEEFRRTSIVCGIGLMVLGAILLVPSRPSPGLAMVRRKRRLVPGRFYSSSVETSP